MFLLRSSGNKNQLLSEKLFSNRIEQDTLLSPYNVLQESFNHFVCGQ